MMRFLVNGLETTCQKARLYVVLLSAMSRRGDPDTVHSLFSLALDEDAGTEARTQLAEYGLEVVFH